MYDDGDFKDGGAIVTAIHVILIFCAVCFIFYLASMVF